MGVWKNYSDRQVKLLIQNPEQLIIMHTALLLVASLTVLISSASGSPLPEPQPQPLFFRQLGNILQKKIGIIRNILGAVARPVLDVKTKKLQFLRGAVDKKIDLVNQKRAYWSRQG